MTYPLAKFRFEAINELLEELKLANTDSGLAPKALLKINSVNGVIFTLPFVNAKPCKVTA